MKVLDRTIDGLKRCYNVLLSEDELENAKISKLQEIAKKVKLDGFRPGKVPLDIVKRMYGESVNRESKQNLIDSTSRQILKDESLSISFRFITDIVKEDENGLQFELKFELIPTFEIQDMSNVKITKYCAEVTDDNITNLLEGIRKERKNWVLDKSAKEVREGQHIVIDLNLLTSLKGHSNDNMLDFEIAVGDKSLVDDFWKHLIGATVGETRKFDINYPKNFGNKNLASKKLQYSATIKKILKATEYKLDDIFAKSIGYDDLEKAKSWAKSHLVSKYDYISHDIMKRELLEKMADLYDFEVPSNMVNIEKSEVEKQLKAEAVKYNKEFSPEIENECLSLAKKRVRLGFVVAQIAKNENINVSKNEVIQAVKNIANMYPGQEEKVYNIYKHPEAMNAVVGPLLEAKVVDFLLSKLKIEEKKCSAEELIAIDEEPFEFFKDSASSTKVKGKSKIEKVEKKNDLSEQPGIKSDKKITNKKKTNKESE